MAQTNSTPEWFNPTGVSKTKPPPTTTVEEEEETEETSDTPAWFNPTGVSKKKNDDDRFRRYGSSYASFRSSSQNSSSSNR